jgi:SAM-dependent methyltransferase
MMRALANQKPPGSTLRISVLACSNGAEVYSILWTLRSAQPDLKITMHAIDISNDILEMAKEGLYSLKIHELVNSQIFERLTEHELRTMFDKEENQFRIKPWIKEGIRWHVADAADPQLTEFLGTQDIVVANRFLCHMDPPHAEKCLRNIANLVAPGGYLFVSGVDLDVRTKLAVDLGWTPVIDSLEEIHNGDASLTRDWPWQYWGLEPFSKKRHDWSIRYASVFRLGHQGSCGNVLCLAQNK